MRVVMVAHTYFPHDTRVRKEALAVAQAGHEVKVICLRGTGEQRTERYSGVIVQRLPVSRQRGRNRLGYLFEYASFFLLASLELARADRVGRVDVVHVHNIPDELVFCALVPKLRGARVVLDLHDPMPELFADKYGIDVDSRAYRWLRKWQMASCSFAHHVIVSSEGIRDSIVSGGVPESDVSLVLNGPVGSSGGGDLNIVYHGSLFDRYGMETVLRGMAAAQERVPNAHLLVFASDVDPHHLERLERLAEELGLSERVAFSGKVPPLAVRYHLATADIGVVPARRSPHIDLVYPTKLFECLSAGLPALVARTPPIERRFGDALRYYEPDDSEDFARALTEMADERGAAAARQPGALPPELAWESIASTVVAAVTGVAPSGWSVAPESRGILAESEG